MTAPKKLDVERIKRIFDDHDLWRFIAEEYDRLDPEYQATLPTWKDVRGILRPSAGRRPAAKAHRGFRPMVDGIDYDSSDQ